MEKKNLNRLFEDFIANRCSPEDIEQLMQHFDSPTSLDNLRNLIEQEIAAQQSEPSSQAVESIVCAVDKKMALTMLKYQAGEKHKEYGDMFQSPLR